MTNKQEHPDLLEDEDTPTGTVNIAHRDATSLAKEREEQTKKITSKFRAVREKLSRGRYSQINRSERSDRRSRP